MGCYSAGLPGDSFVPAVGPFTEFLLLPVPLLQLCVMRPYFKALARERVQFDRINHPNITDQPFCCKVRKKNGMLSTGH